jgi:hypothetical protein
MRSPRYKRVHGTKETLDSYVLVRGAYADFRASFRTSRSRRPTISSSPGMMSSDTIRNVLARDLGVALGSPSCTTGSRLGLFEVSSPACLSPGCRRSRVRVAKIHLGIPNRFVAGDGSPGVVFPTINQCQFDCGRCSRRTGDSLGTYQNAIIVGAAAHAWEPGAPSDSEDSGPERTAAPLTSAATSPVRRSPSEPHYHAGCFMPHAGHRRHTPRPGCLRIHHRR